MEVSIKIKYRFAGNPRGAGEAEADIEYVDKTGKSHIRQQRIQSEDTTKNALILKVCIASLRLLVKPCKVRLFVDCDYLVRVYQQGWLDRWSKSGWKRANGKPPANVEDWKQFYMLTQIHKINFTHCGSRAGTELEKMQGERCEQK